MKIGLIDAELWNKPELKVLNVELMKLGVYYQKQGHQVEVLHKGDYFYDYDKICLFSNKFFVLSYLENHPNVEFYGAYFNNSHYLPFGIDEIDYGEVDYRIYDHFLKFYFKSGIYTEKDILNFKTRKWVRLFPNKKSINVYDILTNDEIYIADEEIFNQPNWREVIKKLSIYPTKMHFINPLIIRNQKDFNDYLELASYGFTRARALILTDTNEEFEELVTNNIDKINSVRYKVLVNIGYNSKNLYSETYYLSQLIPIIQKAIFMNKIGFTAHSVSLSLYSNKPLTRAVYWSLTRWIWDGRYKRYNFYDWFYHEYRDKEEMTFFRNLIKKRSELKEWFFKNINEED